MLHLSSIRSTSAKTIAAGVTVLAAAALLSGCASGSSESSSTASASSSSSSQKLPANFPKSVPLVDGDVIVARGNANDGWSATISPDSKGGFARAESALEKAGFTQAGGASKTQATYTDADYSVSISTPGTSVSYLISTTH